MARIDFQAFGEGTEVVRVYLAAGVGEAEAVERVLSGLGVTFAVEVEPYATSTILGSNSTRQGAGFWVRTEDVDRSANALEAARMVKGLVDRG